MTGFWVTPSAAARGVGRLYFAVQALAGAVWWVCVFTLPAVREATPEQLRASWAYSDSKADLPLLDFAGNGVLIHPNAELEAVGRERGWTVLRPARPYKGKLGDVWCSVRQALGCWPCVA